VCSAGKAQALTRLTHHSATHSLSFGSVVRPAPAPHAGSGVTSPLPRQSPPIASALRTGVSQLCACALRSACQSSSFLIPPSVASAAPLQTRRSAITATTPYLIVGDAALRAGCSLPACLPAAVQRCSYKRAASSVWIDVEACDVVVVGRWLPRR
jgi:hypothetical protein